MKVSNINLYSNSTTTPHFKGNLINKTKKGLAPLMLASGLFMAQSAAADDHMENFYPESEVPSLSSKSAINFVKNMLIGAAAFYGLIYGIGNVMDSDKDKKDKNKSNTVIK